MVQNKKAKIHGLAAKFGLATHAREIWNEHPYVRDITEQVFTRFGYLSLDNGKNILVAEAIRDATTAYNAAARQSPNLAPSVCYLRAFFDTVAHVLAFEIFIGDVRWQPLKNSFTDLVGEIKVSEKKEKWPVKDITPLTAIVLSFMEEDSAAAIISCKLPKAVKAVA